MGERDPLAVAINVDHDLAAGTLGLSRSFRAWMTGALDDASELARGDAPLEVTTVIPRS